MINITSLIVMAIILIVIIEKKKLSEKRKNIFSIALFLNYSLVNSWTWCQK